MKKFSGGNTTNTSYQSYEEWKRLTMLNPDPSKFTIIKWECWRNNTIILINYHNCNTYEGNKIILFRDVLITQIQALKTIDPHFIETNTIKPFARFEPTDEGWFCARILANLI